MKKIDHIAIAVRDLKEASKTFEALGLKLSTSHEVSSMKVQAKFAKIGDTQIELISPTSKDSVVEKFLEKRGEGLHHICFEVENIETTLKELEEKGFQLINKEPQAGAQGRVAFLHPKSTHGVLIELIQRK